jgi:hypothetical protein
MMVSCNDLFYDTDLFISFMNDYWFGDFRWESILLGALITVDRRTEAMVTTEIITEYFTDRWDGLYANVSSYVAEYIAFTTGMSPVEPTYRNKPFEPDRMIRGLRIADRNMRIFEPRVFLHRTLLRYSIEKVTLSSDGENKEIIVHSSFGEKKVPTVEVMRKGTWSGTVEGVFTIDYNPMVLITGGRTPVAVLDPVLMVWNEPDKIDKYCDFPAFTYATKIAEEVNALAEVEEETDLKETLDEIDCGIGQVIDSIYGQLAFRKNKAEEAIAMVARLHINRFPDMLKNLFAESVDWSLLCGPRAWDAKQHAELIATTLPDILDRIRKANARCKEALDWEPFTIINESIVGSNF